MSMFDVLILAILCAHGALGVIASTTSVPTSREQSTCPSRTINYLTHRLHQQCLASHRVSGSSSSQTNSSTITSPTPSHSAVESNRAGQVGRNSTTDYTASFSSSETVVTQHTSNPSSPPSLVQSVTTITATPLASTVPVPLLPSTVEEDSPLESGNFLSFEEWKKQNLINAGQSEHLRRNKRAEQRDPHKRPTNIDNALDSLGDDTEINLDFSGLVPGGPDTVADLANKQADEYNESQRETEPGSVPQASARGKDAGTTSKERYNYASVDCAASVLKTNPEAKSPNTVIMENKDLYMLNKCSAANKFIILELCDDISIDTIVLANFEFFSSSFRTFRVSVSDKYPVRIEKWKTLGTFEARNTREVQAFLIENPIIWARYVRIEFLTHYGSEFYCPVSLIRVHGTTMMEDYKHDLAMNMGEDEDDGDDVPSVDSAEVKDTSEAGDDVVSVTNETSVEEHQIRQIEQTQHEPPEPCTKCSLDEINRMRHENMTSPNEGLAAEDALLADDVEVCRSYGTSACKHTQQEHFSSDLANTKATPLSTASESSTKDSAASSSTSSARRSSTPTVLPREQTRETGTTPQKEIHSTAPAKVSSDQKKSASTVMDSARSNITSKESTRSHPTKQSASSTQSQPASPTIQESFFKSVQKRLQMLESNSSLSLQYIEEQSRALRDAFRKVEQRQLIKTSAFLEHLNQSVLNELREFRQQYDNLWQSTVIELELQREKYQRDNEAMHARLGVLADELIFQRRVSILQMVLILVCLGLILFSRGAINNYLELPLVQSVLSRSPSSKWISIPGDSQTTTPAITRTRSAHQLGSKQGILKSHNRGLSDDSNNEPLSASEMYSPPTPVSYDGFSDAELVKPDSKQEELLFDPVNIERPSTSPPMLPGVEDPSTPKSFNWPDDISIESRMLSPSPSNERMLPPEVRIEHPTPPRHLTWDLPD